MLQLEEMRGRRALDSPGWLDSPIAAKLEQGLDPSEAPAGSWSMLPPDQEAPNRDPLVCKDFLNFYYLKYSFPAYGRAPGGGGLATGFCSAPAGSTPSY